MLKDSKFSSHLSHLSELQIINHKTLDEYQERLKTYEVNYRILKSKFNYLIRIICGLVNQNNYQLLNVLVEGGYVDRVIQSNV